MTSLGWQNNRQSIGLTYKRSADDYLEMVQTTAEDYLMTRVDDAAVSSDNTARATAAMTYGFRKITSDTFKGIIGIPRILTSNHIAPDLVNSIRHPIDTSRQFAKAFGDMSVQDRWVTGLEIALPFKGNVDRLAGKIPGVGHYLEGDLSLSRGRGIILSTSEGQYSVRSPITWANAEPGVLYTRLPLDVRNPFVPSGRYGGNSELLKWDLAEQAGIPRYIDLSKPDNIWGPGVKPRLDGRDLLTHYRLNGFDGVMRPPKAGTSGKAQFFDLERHPDIASVQMHPGGGVHEGPYYKFIMRDRSEIKIIDPSHYNPRIIKKGSTFFDQQGQRIVLQNGKWIKDN